MAIERHLLRHSGRGRRIFRQPAPRNGVDRRLGDATAEVADRRQRHHRRPELQGQQARAFIRSCGREPIRFAGRDPGGRGEPTVGVSRGADTEVPEAIRIAEYEIAYALLDGKDPELELENLAINAMGYGAVKTSYERSQLPIEHIINLVPSSVAWRLLKPFLRDSDALKLSRLS